MFAQDYPKLEVVVIDNASTDDTRSILRSFENRAKIYYREDNVGFAAGQNQAIRLSEAEWILALNPDVSLTPNFLNVAIAAGESVPEIGSISGKLLSMRPDCEIPSEARIDSTGIYFTPNLRHFDRANGQIDSGEYDRFEYVFGVTGAAALYRRKMIEDISISGEFFDPTFFAYREDADVAWRAQLLGWKCLYHPQAVAYHVRTVLPTNRKQVSASINMHSVKNRFLMRIKNVSPALYLKHFLSITARDLLVLVGCLLKEWSSLRAFPLVARNFRRCILARHEIMRRRRVTSDYILGWFSSTPVSYPASEFDELATSARIATH